MTRILCDVQDATEADYAAGLRETFGFTQVHNVWPELHASRPVMLFGWRDFYCEAVGRFPGGLPCVLWTRNWRESERGAMASRLAVVLQHQQAGLRLLWSDVGDALPAGAMLLPPAWLPFAVPAPRGGAGHIICADGSLAAVAAAIAAGAKLHLPYGSVRPETADPTPGLHERAELLRLMLAGKDHALYRHGPPLAAADLLLDLGESAWSWPALAAVRAGVPVIATPSLAWAAELPDGIASVCIVDPPTASGLLSTMADRLLRDAELRHAVMLAQYRAIESLREAYTTRAAETLRAAGFDIAPAPAAPRARRLFLYADTAGWAQDHFVRDIARHAGTWGWEAHVGNGHGEPLGDAETAYSPSYGAADAIIAALPATTGLWSHVSYGGWFTDDALDLERLPKVRAHATNLYLHALTGLPYLAAGVDTDLFCPGTGSMDRATRHRRDRRLVIGFTASLQFNAAVKLFHDLWVPATRAAGTDGALAEARFCARPLPVWDVADARGRAEVARYLKGVDIYLCTSISEGCSLSVLEAAAAGCVIVSTPCGNAPELASEIVPWEADGIAAALRRYADDRERLYEDAARTRELAVRWWSWRAEVKAAAWRAWLAGADMPSWRDQVPYVARGGVGPEDFLRRSRELRESAVPALVRGNMMGS